MPISPLCLFLLLGGGAAFAATQLPKSSVGSRQLKRNAVNSQKVRNGSLRLADFKKAQRAKLRGARGSQGEIGAPGPAGPQGEPATALWAVVDENGNLVRGSGVLSASGKPGTYTRVTFDRDITACAMLASLGRGPGGKVSVGEVSADEFVTNLFDNDEVLVRTSDSDGSAVSKRFHLAVFC